MVLDTTLVVVGKTEVVLVGTDVVVMLVGITDVVVVTGCVVEVVVNRILVVG